MTSVTERQKLHSDMQQSWNGTFRTGVPISEGSGITSRFEFVDALNRVLVPEFAERVFWTVESADQNYYLPCVIERKGGELFGRSELKHIPDFYPGRSGLAELAGGERVFSDMLAKVFDEQGRWDSFSLSVLADGATERELLATARRKSSNPFLESSLRYPYMMLPESWDDLYSGFTKKFRYNIRNAQKLLSEQGELTLECITDESEVRQFLDDAYSVERKSWKEEAGTSLTKNKVQQTFHEQLAPIAATSDLLRSYILYLDRKPVAHVYGLLCDNVFYSLKLSYIEEYRKYAPGIVVTALVLQDLISDGVKCWDWCGPTEEYKRRWTKDEYCLRTYKFYSNSLTGRLLRVRRKTKGLFSSS